MDRPEQWCAGPCFDRRATAIPTAFVRGREAIELFLETGAYLVPTIHAGKYVAAKAQVEDYYPPELRVKAAAVGPGPDAVL